MATNGLEGIAGQGCKRQGDREKNRNKSNAEMQNTQSERGDPRVGRREVDGFGGAGISD